MASNSSVTVRHSEQKSKVPNRLYYEIGKKECEDCQSYLNCKRKVKVKEKQKQNPKISFMRRK